MTRSYFNLLIALILLAFHGLCFSQESPNAFKLAVAQMSVVGGERDANLAHAGEMIAEAAHHGAQIVLLPEAMELVDRSISIYAGRKGSRRQSGFLSFKCGQGAWGIHLLRTYRKRWGDRLQCSGAYRSPG